jgi:hypothetical protein
MTNSCYFFRKIRDMSPNNDARVDLMRRMIGTRCTYFEFKTTHNTLCMVISQGLVTIQVNILSMYKHIQGRTSFFTPARFKSYLFFKFLLIYSKPCLVQLPRPYSFKKISWPPLDYLLWRRSGRFCQEFAWVENNMDPKWK